MHEGIHPLLRAVLRHPQLNTPHRHAPSMDYSRRVQVNESRRRATSMDYPRRPQDNHHRPLVDNPRQPPPNGHPEAARSIDYSMPPSAPETSRAVQNTTMPTRHVQTTSMMRLARDFSPKVQAHNLHANAAAGPANQQTQPPVTSRSIPETY